MNKVLTQFITIIITFFATLILVYGANYVYARWFDYAADILLGNDVSMIRGGVRLSYCDTLSESDISAAERILSEAGISYRLGERDALVLVRGIDEKRAVKALVESGYDFEGSVNNAFDL